MKKIYVDAGHGGSDSGAVGTDFLEKDFNLKISNKVIEKLKLYNCKVFYTRQEDKTVSLSDRTNNSNNNKCDIFISIQCNSASSVATGFESFSYNGNSELQDILHDEIIKVLPLKDRGKKSNKNYYVLKNTTAKAIILELGFINNPSDSKILMENEENICNAIVRGIVKYFGLAPISTTREVYRVCVGSYTVKENAQNMLNNLTKDGYTGFITKATI